MSNLRVLNQKAIEEVLDMKSVIKTVEQAYTLKVKGEAALFPLIFHEFDLGKADMDIKSGHLVGANIFGLKLVSWFGDNAKKNIPTLIGTVMVFDSRTGEPMGILNGEYVTCMRTGAAGAIGAKYLARKDSKNLLMIGTGHQAPYQIAAVLLAMENIEKVFVYNPNSYDRAVVFANGVKSKLNENFLNKYKDDENFDVLAKRFDIAFEAVSDIESAARKADIIITATPSRKPLIMKEWVKPGTHISCIGADMEGKQEIDENIFSGARVFVDDITQAVNVGEIEIPIKKGVFSKEDIVGEIGSVILGDINGRLSDNDITIFDSTGIALQDLLTSKYCLNAAKEKNIGVVVEL